MILQIAVGSFGCLGARLLASVFNLLLPREISPIFADWPGRAPGGSEFRRTGRVSEGGVGGGGAVAGGD